ncbi:MAG: hypothetical protein A2Z66_10905 [Chloroflexi bacterium RBG_13_66_10]|nr:MAG: hypothetical protein A2Z66_10905 [Chloroflexi bacterium RBG_13_66_10]
MDQPQIRPLGKHRRDGFHFGVICGVAFAVTAWGIDAAAFLGVPADMVWIRLVVGGIAVAVIGGLIGLIVAWLDKGLAGLLAWAVAGVAFGWLGSHILFDGASLAAGVIDPRFRGMDVYPFVRAAKRSASVAMTLVGGLSAVAGILQLVALDQARMAYSRVGRWLALAMGVPFFLLAGFVSDDVSNRPVRDPQLNMVNLVDFVLDGGDTGLGRRELREMHVAAVDPIRSMLSEPRRVMLGDYDSRFLMTTTVEIEFDGGWARCTMVNGQPSYCRPADPIYTDGFLCVLSSEEHRGEGCQIEVSDAASLWLDEQSDAIGPTPALDVVGRMGRVVLLSVGAEAECRFRGAQPVVLEACGGF